MTYVIRHVHIHIGVWLVHVGTWLIHVETWLIHNICRVRRWRTSHDTYIFILGYHSSVLGHDSSITYVVCVGCSCTRNDVARDCGTWHVHDGTWLIDVGTRFVHDGCRTSRYWDVTRPWCMSYMCIIHNICRVCQWHMLCVRIWMSYYIIHDILHICRVCRCWDMTCVVCV